MLTLINFQDDPDLSSHVPKERRKSMPPNMKMPTIKVTIIIITVIIIILIISIIQVTPSSPSPDPNHPDYPEFFEDKLYLGEYQKYLKIRASL